MAPAAQRVDVLVPMRDGVRLATRALRPAGHRRGPALLYRTPYGLSAEETDNGRTIRAALRRGFVVVLQDVRGRHGSEGVFVPYRQEGPDGHDAVEWVARQPWCDGRVGMFGLSYPAAAQWLAALEAPPHLEAIVPAMSFSRADHFIYFGGAFDLSWPRWAADNIVPDARRRQGLTPVPADEVVREASALPLRHRSALTESVPEYEAWLSHPPGDPWWDWANVAARASRVRAAVLHLSGWHDEPYGPVGATENFAALAAGRSATRRNQLVLGPWTHGVDAIGSTRSGDRAFGPRAALDYDALVLDFMDEHLRGHAPPGHARHGVRAYVMGADRWVEADAWPPPTLAETLLLGPGVLGAATPAGTTSLESDPAHPPSIGADLNYGSFDVAAWRGRPDVATFDGPVFHRDVDILGVVEAVLEASATVPSFDLFAWLLDVAPDGRAMTLSSPGNVMQRVRQAPGGPPLEVALRHQLTGHRFRAGHRARLLVTTGLEGALSPNLQTGASELESARAERGVVTIHHSAARPSRVVLPTLRPGMAR